MQEFLATPIGKIIKTIRPVWLLIGGFLYALGVGITVFRGEAVDWPLFWLGLGFSAALQVALYCLAAYFETQLEINRKGLDSDTLFVRNGALTLAVTGLAISAMLTVLLMAQHAFSSGVALLMGCALLFVIIFGVPPFRLAFSGYADLIEGLYLIILVPALGFLLQAHEVFNGLSMLTFPLLAIFLAMRLAFGLPQYYADIQSGRQTMLTRLGWQRGMFMHNLLILLAFLLVGAGSLVQFPWSLTWPRLLALPIGLFEIWQMWQISNGGPTRWPVLKFTAGVLFGLSLYLNLLMLWMG